MSDLVIPLPETWRLRTVCEATDNDPHWSAYCVRSKGHTGRHCDALVFGEPRGLVTAVWDQ